MFTFKYCKKISFNHGFTIIEALVAITILLIGVLGPMAAATRGITDGLYAGNELVATYLAQEGIELVLAKVKFNLENGGDWLNDLSNCLAPNNCSVDVASNSFNSCVDSGCDLRYNLSNNLYTVNGLDGPVFNRRIQIIKSTGLIDNREVKIETTINWSNKSIPRSLKLSDYIYDYNK